jgi:hypothetical protein
MWIVSPSSGSLAIGTILAIGNSLPFSGHQPVLKAGDELLIEHEEEGASAKAEVIQKSPDEMVIALQDGTRLRLSPSESKSASAFESGIETEDWIVRERW